MRMKIESHRVIIDFKTHISVSGDLVDVEVQIPFVPKIGEWFDAKSFIQNDAIREQLCTKEGCDGVLYVKWVSHAFDIENSVMITRLYLALTEDDAGFYKNRFD